MGRMYSVAFENLQVTNDSTQDILQLVAAAGHVVKLHYLEIYSSVTSDERVRLILQRVTAAGSGGSAASENPLDAGDAAADAVVTTLNTTPGTTTTPLVSFYWSQLSPLQWLPTPEGRIVVPPSGIVVLNLATAVAATRSWSGLLQWEEIG